MAAGLCWTAACFTGACGDDEGGGSSDTKADSDADSTATTTTGTGTATGSSDASGTEGAVCPAELVDCGGVCSDLANDSAHCGACNVVCPEQTSCSNALCVPACPVGQVACAEGCVDPQSDADRCGVGPECAGGSVCAADQACVAARCAPAWQGAAVLHATNAYLSSPVVVTGDSGTTHVAWIESAGRDGDVDYGVKTRAYTPTSGVWGDVVALELRPGYASKPSLALDAATGVTTAVWLHGGRGDTSVFRVMSARHHPQLGTWSQPMALSSASGHASAPVLAGVDGGAIHVAWQFDFGAGMYGLVARSFDPVSGVWMPEAQVAGAGVSRPTLAAAQGRAVLAWEQQRADGGFDIDAAYGSLQAPWSVQNDVDGRTFNASRPSVAIAGNGCGQLVWVSEGRDGVYDIHARALGVADCPSGVGGEVVELTQGPQPAAFPQVIMAAQGEATAVWLQSNGVLSNLHAARWDGTTGAWSGGGSVDGFDFADAAAELSLSVDAGGWVTLAWPEASSLQLLERDALAVRRAPGTDSWTAPTALEAISGEVKEIGGASGAGVVQLAWYQTAGDVVTLYGARLQR